MYEVFFVESGTGVIKVDGREQPLKRGVCVTVEPGEAHEIVNGGADDLLLIYFGIEV